jgi:hypothetical protein
MIEHVMTSSDMSDKEKKHFFDFWDSLEIDISHIEGHNWNPPNTLNLKVM